MIHNNLRETTDISQLGLISGNGDTPLHTTVKNNNLGLTRIILQHDPSLLNREDAVGRTPFEMAEDTALARLSENPPPMPSDGWSFNDRRARRLQLHREWHNDITNRSESSFADKSSYVYPSRRKQIWDLLQETKAKLQEADQWKRKLVSVFGSLAKCDC
jgi:hypothetical protein